MTSRRQCVIAASGEHSSAPPLLPGIGSGWVAAPHPTVGAELALLLPPQMLLGPGADQVAASCLALGAETWGGEVHASHASPMWCQCVQLYLFLVTGQRRSEFSLAFVCSALLQLPSASADFVSIQHFWKKSSRHFPDGAHVREVGDKWWAPWPAKLSSCSSWHHSTLECTTTMLPFTTLLCTAVGHYCLHFLDWELRYRRIQWRAPRRTEKSVAELGIEPLFPERLNHKPILVVFSGRQYDDSNMQEMSV